MAALVGIIRWEGLDWRSDQDQASIDWRQLLTYREQTAVWSHISGIVGRGSPVGCGLGCEPCLSSAVDVHSVIYWS